MIRLLFLLCAFSASAAVSPTRYNFATTNSPAALSNIIASIAQAAPGGSNKVDGVGGSASNLTVRGQSFIYGTNSWGDTHIFTDPESGDLSFFDSRGDLPVRIHEGMVYAQGFVTDNPEVVNLWQVQDPVTFSVMAGVDTNGVAHANLAGGTNLPMTGVTGLTEVTGRLAQAELDISTLMFGGGGGTGTVTNVWDIDLALSVTNGALAVWTNSAASNSVLTLSILWSGKTTNDSGGGRLEWQIVRSNGVDVVTSTNDFLPSAVGTGDVTEAQLISSTNIIFAAGTNAANTRTTDATNGLWSAVDSRVTGATNAAVSAATNSAKSYADVPRNYLKKFDVTDEFLGVASGSTPQGPLRMINSQSSGDIGNITAASGMVGVAELSTATSANSYAYVRSYPSAIVFNNGAYTNEWLVRFNDLSSDAEHFTARIGFSDAFTAAANNESACFLYSHTTNSAKLLAFCSASATGTEADTGLTVEADTWYKLQVAVTNSTAYFFTNGVLATSIAQNVPGSGVYSGFGAIIFKQAGTTARTMYIDYCRFAFDLTTSR